MKHYRLVEVNLSFLYDATNAFHRRKVSAADFINILEVRYDLLPPNSLVVKGTIQGSDPDPYMAIIKFLNVSRRGRVQIETLEGNVRIAKIDPKQNDVQVFCPCKSFMWAFNTPNNRLDALYEPETNLRTEKPKGTGTHSPNETGSVGLCKHLVALANYLKDHRIIGAL
jgi:hypothetical protein